MSDKPTAAISVNTYVRPSEDPARLAQAELQLAEVQAGRKASLKLMKGLAEELSHGSSPTTFAEKMQLAVRVRKAISYDVLNEAYKAWCESIGIVEPGQVGIYESVSARIDALLAEKAAEDDGDKEEPDGDADDLTFEAIDEILDKIVDRAEEINNMQDGERVLKDICDELGFESIKQNYPDDWAWLLDEVAEQLRLEHNDVDESRCGGKCKGCGKMTPSTHLKKHKGHCKTCAIHNHNRAKRGR